MRARTADARTCRAHARACGCAFGRARNRAEPCKPFPSAWTACGFGSQAFYQASAFNADIGAWSTASVRTLTNVCAAPGPVARHCRRPRTRSAGPRCGAAGCAQRHRRRARARARAGTRLRGAMGVGMACAEETFDIHEIRYVYIFVYIYVCSRTGRVYVYVCVYQCAC